MAGHAVLDASKRQLARSDSLIGISAAQVDDVLRSHLGLAEGKAVLVTDVADDSPAKQAGIQKNDILFIDSSHQVHVANDVVKLFCNVMARWRSGKGAGKRWTAAVTERGPPTLNGFEHATVDIVGGSDRITGLL